MRQLELLGLASILILLGCGGRPASLGDAGQRASADGLQAEPDPCVGPPTPTQPIHCFQACSDDAECVVVERKRWCECGSWVVNRRFVEIVRDKARAETNPLPDAGYLPACSCWTCLAGPPVCIAGVCGRTNICTRDGGFPP